MAGQIKSSDRRAEGWVSKVQGDRPAVQVRRPDPSILQRVVATRLERGLPELPARREADVDTLRPFKPLLELLARSLADPPSLAPPDLVEAEDLDEEVEFDLEQLRAQARVARAQGPREPLRGPEERREISELYGKLATPLTEAQRAELLRRLRREVQVDEQTE